MLIIVQIFWLLCNVRWFTIIWNSTTLKCTHSLNSPYIALSPMINYTWWNIIIHFESLWSWHNDSLGAKSCALKDKVFCTTISVFKTASASFKQYHMHIKVKPIILLKIIIRKVNTEILRLHAYNRYCYWHLLYIHI